MEFRPPGSLLSLISGGVVYGLRAKIRQVLLDLSRRPLTPQIFSVVGVEVHCHDGVYVLMTNAQATVNLDGESPKRFDYSAKSTRVF